MRVPRGLQGRVGSYDDQGLYRGKNKASKFISSLGNIVNRFPSNGHYVCKDQLMGSKSLNHGRACSTFSIWGQSKCSHCA